MDLYPALLATVRKRAGKEASLSFEEYIDEFRQRHWDYALNDQIRLKQITSSMSGTKRRTPTEIEPSGNLSTNTGCIYF